MYWAPGAVHGPHQVFKEWADKYKGKFDEGWDKLIAKEIFAAPETAWLDSRQHRTDSARSNDAGVGQTSLNPSAPFNVAADGNFRRLLSNTPTRRSASWSIVSNKPDCGITPSSFISGAITVPRAEGQNGSISELLAQNQIPNTVEQQINALDETRRPRCPRHARPTTCIMQAGLGQVTRRSAAQNWLPLTLAARVIRWSFHGQRNQAGQESCVRNSPRSGHRPDAL